MNLPDAAEQPRVLLVSVPYALKAADAETLSGKPLSAFVLAPSADSASSGSGEKTGSARALSTTILPTAAITTQNQVAKFVDGAGTVGDSLMTDTDRKSVV